MEDFTEERVKAPAFLSSSGSSSSPPTQRAQFLRQDLKLLGHGHLPGFPTSVYPGQPSHTSSSLLSLSAPEPWGLAMDSTAPRVPTLSRSPLQWPGPA